MITEQQLKDASTALHAQRLDRVLRFIETTSGCTYKQLIEEFHEFGQVQLNVMLATLEAGHLIQWKVESCKPLFKM